MKKNIATSIIVFVVLMFIAFLLDYLNCMGGTNINLDFISIFISNGIVVLLYYITFCTLDKRTITKDENKTKIAFVMMKETYRLIEENLSIWTTDIVKRYVVPKVDFNETMPNEPTITYIQNAPFQFDEHIFEFAKEGIISDKDFEVYIILKNEYRNFIDITITFFDRKEAWDISRNKITQAMQKMKEIINEQNLH